MKGILGNKIRTITCAGCGQTVTARMQPSRRYCSHACYRSRRKPNRKTGGDVPCAFCGKPTYFSAHRIKAAKRLFCCASHANAWQSRNKTCHVCANCKQPFRCSPSRQKTVNIRYCSNACRLTDPILRRRLLQMNVDQQQGKTTKPEAIGYSILDRLGLAYLPQHTVNGKFTVDAFVPALRLVVQFDGDYWHGHPTHFPNPDTRQQKRMTLDRSQDAYLKTCGYKILRFWESDLLNNPGAVRRRLLLACRRHRKPLSRHTEVTG